MSRERSDNSLEMQGLIIRSCDVESLKPVDGATTGDIPPWLEGTLIRDGPGLFKVGPDEYRHWFDGLALLHRFEIRRGGGVSYQNRFLRSTAYQKNLKAGRIVVTEFGTAAHPDPCASLFDRLRSVFSLDFTDNANINAMKIGDGIYVATETSYITRIDPQTLETKEKVDLNKLVTVNTCTAHPHYAADGTVFNIGSSFTSLLQGPAYCLVTFPSKGEESLSSGRVVCRIPCSRPLYPSYYHSFGMTDNYVVFLEQSLNISAPQMMWKHVSGGAYIDALQWNPQQMVRFHLVRRSTGEVLKTHLVSDPFMVFHHANAYESEDGKELVVDLCAYEDDRVLRAFLLKDLRQEQDPAEFLANTRTRTLRFVLPVDGPTKEQIDSGKNMVSLGGTGATATPRPDGSIHCQPENLTPDLSTFEMPQINYKAVNGKKHKYIYGIARSTDHTSVSGVAKVDVEKRSHVMWSSAGAVPSEPVFVARPGATLEDDGVLLCSVIAPDKEKEISLLVLDAVSMRELSRTRFQCPGAIPSDLHGAFYAT